MIIRLLCLTWKEHIHCISKTISRNICVINTIHRTLYPLLCYCNLFLPYLSYDILLWGNIWKSYLDKIVKLQKRAIRTVSNSHYRSHSGPLFAKCLTVTDMYSLELGVFMYNFSINDLPVALRDYFHKRSDIHDYPTRRINNYK